MPPEPNYDDLEDPEGILDAWEAMKLRAGPRSPEDQARLQAFLDRVLKPLAPGDPRRHHFIPEFFLRRFAGDDERLAVVPIDGGRSKMRHVSRIAVVNDLYTSIDVEIGETVALERILAQADGEAAAAIARLSGGVFPPSSEDRATLAIWLALLAVRDPHTRRQMEALYDSSLKFDLSLVAEPEAARVRLRENLDREPSDEEVADLVDAANDLDSFEMVPHQNELLTQILDGALSVTPHLMRRLYTVVRIDMHSENAMAGLSRLPRHRHHLGVNHHSPVSSPSSPVDLAARTRLLWRINWTARSLAASTESLNWCSG